MSDGLQRVSISIPDPVAPADHDAKMIAVADAAAATPEVDPARPAWLPEKFKTVEEMAASYKELETRLGGQKPAEAVPEVTPVVAVDEPAASAVVASAGLDMAALQTEFATGGALSDASLAKLAAAGIDKATVDNYIAGQTARADAFKADVLTAVPGGADKYGEMVEWAKANLTPAEIDAFNVSIDTSDANRAKLAVAGLGAKFSAAVGNEPRLEGGRPGSSNADVFASIAEMTAAMRDPRYKTDPAYNRKVGEKVGRSNIL